MRHVLDPNSSALRLRPQNEQDLMICAKNSWLLAFDNLSRLGERMSDALCALSTGGGFATRRLYTDSDEELFDAKRPIIVNGIDFAMRPDLADRVIALLLPEIEDQRRRQEAEVFEDLERMRPRVLGALLDALSGALRNLPSVELADVPRMADFAYFGVAVEKTLSWPPGSFMAAYVKNRQELNARAVEGSPVAGPLIRFLGQVKGEAWRGTMTDLYDKLHAAASEQEKRLFPKTARGLGEALTRIKPSLRAAEGIRLKKLGRQGHSKRHHVEIVRLEDTGGTDLRKRRLGGGLTQ